ncbi:MAG TPA: hypothetical protein VFT19_13780 [Solirubrobacterales bacterium]|nr:hypothetical protein [Solirubrobacterales bacterium]
MKMSKSRRAIAILLACGALGAAPGAAQADFGLNNFKVQITGPEGEAVTQAGSHPFAMTTSFGVNYLGEGADAFTEGRIKDAFIAQVPGLAGDATAYPRCSTVDFATVIGSQNQCADETAIGVVAANAIRPTSWVQSPVFNLVAPPGVVVRLGFRTVLQNIVVDVGINPEAPNNPVARARNLSQLEYIFGSKFQLWGDPSDEGHDNLRGKCGYRPSELPVGEEYEFLPSGGACESVDRDPFLTLPTRCAGQNPTTYAGDAWEQPGALLANGEPDLADPAWVTGGFQSPPFTGCGGGIVKFTPTISARPTSRAAQSPTGLDFGLDFHDEGLTSAEGLSQSHLRKAVVTLPEGMTANPSVAEGLEVCSQADLERETVGSAPGAGCPEASKIGTIEVESPLVEEILKGALYQATPYANLAEDSLLAFYIVIKSAELGIIVKQPTKVVPNPATGQLEAITDEAPQLPFSHFRLHFREGGRSPLVTPPTCGTHTATAKLYPWSGADPVEVDSAFTIISGPDNGPCPSGSPFGPGFEAGTVNNAAGEYSPFNMRLTRKDGDQDMSRFSAKLPPGMVARLAGVAQCSDAEIAAAKAKTGLEEIASPSCPAAAGIGRVAGGAGAGSQLTYVGGKLYLAGPTGGAPLSVVAIVPAVAGPFDIGNVVVRQALRVDPRSAEVTADGSASDPLPTILAGIPLNVRDIRVYVDKPSFTLNPTSCAPSQVSAWIQGSGGALASLGQRFQAASCASLGFKPRLALRLRGKATKRGGHPALRGVFRPRAGDANLEKMVLRLPRSAFLDQAHIRTICTRVQFAAGAGNGRSCPKGAIYGRARAFSPLLDAPLEGPVFLRSSNNKLPDFVAALRGIIDVEAVARIDSQRGGIRATFTNVPDAPLSRVVVNMQGGKKGLIVNSTNICRGKHRANARMIGQNGRRNAIKPLVRAQCAKKRMRARHSRARRAG